MAKQVTSICDWRDDPADDPCGRPAAYDAQLRVDGITLTGDLCTTHKNITIERIRLSGFVPQHIQLDGKARQTYITATGKVVAQKDIRMWAMEAGKVKTTSGRLPISVIEDYLAQH